MELVRCRSYDMDELSRHVLKRGREGKGEVVDLAALFRWGGGEWLGE